MTKDNSLKIVPVYSGKKKLFQGYAVYEGKTAVKKDGKPVVLSYQDDQRYYVEDDNGNIGPKKKVPDGVYGMGSVDADNQMTGYHVRYGKNVWIVSPEQYDRHMQPALVFKVKTEDGVFKGYTITQYDENSQEMKSRGSILPEDVIYKRLKNGSYACYYNDVQSGGVVNSHYMESISNSEYNKRRLTSSQRGNKTLSQSAQANITVEEHLNSRSLPKDYSRN